MGVLASCQCHDIRHEAAQKVSRSAKGSSSGSKSSAGQRGSSRGGSSPEDFGSAKHLMRDGLVRWQHELKREEEDAKAKVLKMEQEKSASQSFQEPQTPLSTAPRRLSRSSKASESLPKSPASTQASTPSGGNIAVAVPKEFKESETELGEGTEKFEPEPESPLVTIKRKHTRQRLDEAAKKEAKTGYRRKVTIDCPWDNVELVTPENGEEQQCEPASPKTPLSPTTPKTAKSRRLSALGGFLVRSKTRSEKDFQAHYPFRQRILYDTPLDGWNAINGGRFLGFVSQKGSIPHMANQDEFGIVHESNHQVYIVVDGFGPDGEAISKFARDFLLQGMKSLCIGRKSELLKAGECSQVLKGLRPKLEAEARRGARLSKVGDLKQSGCSAAVVVVTPSRGMRGAWIGDCECIAGNRKSPKEPVSLTPVRKSPTSKGIGHWEPDEFVEADVDLAGLDFLILGTPGLWCGVNKSDASSEVAELGPDYSQHACYSLANRSQDFQLVEDGPANVEDATVLVVWLSTTS